MKTKAAPVSANWKPVIRVVGYLCASGLMPLSTALSAPNFLVIMGDDMGVETLSCYGLNDNTAVTPTLDNLCDHGIRFDNMWSQPVCSPTRATILTGRYGFRTGIGRPIVTPPDAPKVVPEKPPGAHPEGVLNRPSPPESPPGLSLDEFTLPMALKTDPELGYETAAFGKWHLADAGNGYAAHPNRAGFDHFAGGGVGGFESFFAFSKSINGRSTPGSTVYAPTDKVNETIAWLKERDDAVPWIAYLSFNLPHSPYHLPPLELLHSDAKNLDPYSDDVNDNPHPYFKAMLEAMDTEIGRLLGTLTPAQRDNTYIIFLGDNGTSGGVIQPPFDRQRGKGTVYQGGMNVPFMVTGPGIDGGQTSDALINTVDLYATFLELAGIDVEAALPDDRGFDSVSFARLLHDPDAVPARDFVYADAFGHGLPPAQAIRNETYKLLAIGGEEEFYDLENDPYEHVNLLTGNLSATEADNYRDLKSRMAALHASE